MPPDIRVLSHCSFFGRGTLALCRALCYCRNAEATKVLSCVSFRRAIYAVDCSITDEVASLLFWER